MELTSRLQKGVGREQGQLPNAFPGCNFSNSKRWVMSTNSASGRSHPNRHQLGGAESPRKAPRVLRECLSSLVLVHRVTRRAQPGSQHPSHWLLKVQLALAMDHPNQRVELASSLRPQEFFQKGRRDVWITVLRLRRRGAFNACPLQDQIRNPNPQAALTAKRPVSVIGPSGPADAINRSQCEGSRAVERAFG